MFPPEQIFRSNKYEYSPIYDPKRETMTNIC